MSPFCMFFPVASYSKTDIEGRRKGRIYVRINKQTFLYNASVLAFSNLALQALGFIYRIALSRLAGAEGLGVYRLVGSVYIVVNTFCLSGVTLACSRLSASKLAQGRPEQIRALMRLAMGIFLLIFTICAVVIAPFHDFIAQRLLGDDRTAMALPIMLICLFLTGIENLIKSLFLGIGKVQYAAISEIGEQVIRIFAVIALLLTFGGQDYGRIAALIMLGMAISECFSAGFLGILYHRKIACLGSKKDIRADAGLLHSMLDIAMPISCAAVVSNIISSANAVILPGRLIKAGLTTSGALSALGVVGGMAAPLITLPVALVSAVSTVLIPNMTAAQARRDSRRVRALTEKALTVTGFICIPATAAIIPLAPSLARIFFNQTIPLSYMALLGIAAVLSYYEMMTASLLHGIGEQRRVVIAAVCGEVLQLGLTWLLAAQSSLQIYGYLIAMLISPIPIVIINMWGLRKCTGVRFCVSRVMGAPMLCGITIYLWVRVFYGFFLGICGGQWEAILMAAVGTVILYLGLLRLLGIRIPAYVSKRMTHINRYNFFGFL